MRRRRRRFARPPGLPAAKGMRAAGCCLLLLLLAAAQGVVRARLARRFGPQRFRGPRRAGPFSAVANSPWLACSTSPPSTPCLPCAPPPTTANHQPPPPPPTTFKTRRHRPQGHLPVQPAGGSLRQAVPRRPRRLGALRHRPVHLELGDVARGAPRAKVDAAGQEPGAWLVCWCCSCACS